MSLFDPKKWTALVGGGASLKPYVENGQLAKALSGSQAMLVNRAFELLSVAPSMKAAVWWTDWRFWAGRGNESGYKDSLLTLKRINGIDLHAGKDALVGRHRHYPPEVRVWPWSKTTDGWSYEQGAVNHGSNGGMAALQVAYALGARRVILLGIDLDRNPQFGTHWHSPYPWGQSSSTPYGLFCSNWKRLVETAPPDLELWNADPSALTSVRRLPIPVLLTALGAD